MKKSDKKHEFLDPPTLKQTGKTRNGPSVFPRVPEGQNFGNFQNRKKTVKNGVFAFPKRVFTSFFPIFAKFFAKFRDALALLWGVAHFTPPNGNGHSMSQKCKFCENFAFFTKFFVVGQIFFWFFSILTNFFPFLSIFVNFCRFLQKIGKNLVIFTVTRLSPACLLYPGER